MPDVPNRSLYERDLAADLRASFADERARAERGEEPDWERLRGRTDEAIAVVLLLVFMLADKRFNKIVLGGQGANLPPGTASNYVAQRAGTVSAALVRNMQAEFQVLRGTAQSQAELSGGLDVVFSDARAEGTAVTEITGAVSTAETQAAELYNRQLSIGAFGVAAIGAVGLASATLAPLTAIWKTELDSKVCPICFPLEGEPKDSWEHDFPDGPPAHPRCRCTLDWIEA